MKRTIRFIKPFAFIDWKAPSGDTFKIPLFQGILKHPLNEELEDILNNYNSIHKYTSTALQKASWPILREFPVSWLKICLKNISLKPARRRALEFLLDLS